MRHCIFRDGCATPRAGTLHYADAVLPWRFEDPAPPPVPPKSELRVRPTAYAENIPKRVTPWLLRHVKAPESHVTRPPKKAAADIMGSPKPPTYQAVLQQQQQQQQQQKEGRASEERPRTTDSPRSHNLPKLASLPALQTTVQAPTPDHSPPKPAPLAKPDRSDKRKEPGFNAHAPQSTVRGTHEQVRPRPRTKSSPRPVPVPESVVPVPQPTYTHAKSFPEPPPYRRTAGESSPPSARSRSLPRSRKKSSTFEKDAPLPPLPNHPHPPLPSSAMSRIHAAYKVSNEFGNAVMRQEVRLATPLPDITPTPRVGRRFMTASEIESFRKSRQRATKGSSEHQARRGH